MFMVLSIPHSDGVYLLAFLQHAFTKVKVFVSILHLLIVHEPILR